MPLQKKKFVNYVLDEDRQQSKVKPVTVKLNKDDQANLEIVKKVMDCPMDAKVIRACIDFTAKGIPGIFSERFFRYFVKDSRKRYDDNE